MWLFSPRFQWTRNFARLLFLWRRRGTLLQSLTCPFQSTSFDHWCLLVGRLLILCTGLAGLPTWLWCQGANCFQRLVCQGDVSFLHAALRHIQNSHHLAPKVTPTVLSRMHPVFISRALLQQDSSEALHLLKGNLKNQRSRFFARRPHCEHQSHCWRHIAREGKKHHIAHPENPWSLFIDCIIARSCTYVSLYLEHGQELVSIKSMERFWKQDAENYWIQLAILKYIFTLNHEMLK